eukprot:g15958.t1
MRRLDLAKTLRAFGVYDQCETLVASLAEVEKVVETGEYRNKDTGMLVAVEKRRLTMMPEKVDRDDQFQRVMGDFVEKAKERAAQISVYACNVFGTYKELGVFFDDTASLWPLPAEGSGSKDLFHIMHDFAGHCLRAYRDLQSPGLRPLRDRISRIPRPSMGGASSRDMFGEDSSRSPARERGGGDPHNELLDDSFLSDAEAPEFVSDRRVSLVQEAASGEFREEPRNGKNQESTSPRKRGESRGEAEKQVEEYGGEKNFLSQKKLRRVSLTEFGGADRGSGTDHGQQHINYHGQQQPNSPLEEVTSVSVRAVSKTSSGNLQPMRESSRSRTSSKESAASATISSSRSTRELLAHSRNAVEHMSRISATSTTISKKPATPRASTASSNDSFDPSKEERLRDGEKMITTRRQARGGGAAGGETPSTRDVREKMGTTTSSGRQSLSATCDWMEDEVMGDLGLEDEFSDDECNHSYLSSASMLSQIRLQKRRLSSGGRCNSTSLQQRPLRPMATRPGPLPQAGRGGGRGHHGGMASALATVSEKTGVEH